MLLIICTMVRLAQEDLNKFLETAQELQLKSIGSKDKEDSDNSPGVKNNDDAQKFTKYTLNEHTHDSILDSLEELADSFDNSDGALDNCDVAFDNSDVALDKSNIALVKTESEEDKLVLNTNIELDLQIEQMIEKNLGLWQCKVCGKTKKKKSHLKEHTETHIEDVSHTCHVCNKTVSTRKTLKEHIAYVHSELSYSWRLTYRNHRLYKKGCAEAKLPSS